MNDVLKLAERPIFDLDEVCEFVLEVVQIANGMPMHESTHARLQTQCDRMWGRMIKEKWTGMGAWTNSGRGLSRSWQPPEETE